MISAENAVQLTQELIRIDTSNPPGNEESAALFLEGVLGAAGIKTEIYFPVPKRANIFARIKGRKRGRPVIILSHIDVVPAKGDEWTVDPFGGELRDGFIYGRGAIDMKAQTICQLLAFMNLYKEGIEPEQDIIFLATCDEEVGGHNGVEFMLHRIPDLKEASFVLSEGGSIVEENGLVHAQVSVAEKKLAQFMIRARGTGGHGSMPHKDNANEKVVRASHRILSHPWPLKPTSIVSTYMNAVLKGKKGKGFRYSSLRGSLKNKNFREFVKGSQVYNALLRNTVTLTILKGGEKVNVIPGESSAYFDARLLPTEGHDSFFKKVRRLCGNDVELVRIGSDVSKELKSGYNSQYFRGIGRAVNELKGAVPVLPFLTTGATDMRYFRNLGIPAYGFFPISLANEELFRMHGVDERISVANIREGLAGCCEILKFLATCKA
ncbi:MAG TPA: M20/M25/M40 family metallo-hydrolase [Syntrophorhabdaceae bacterium]|mgnify:CR=1 FL=1|nr:M20/M25/M40 family metallo-hydrolase [Syntrophorhabdaceae bacterium]HQM82137.1 M20/M25/M40 family metallo-hydrolase [Syntrophorhabdaceae bacterium]